MRINLSQFGGVVPKITNARKMARYSAQRARNVELSSGALNPIKIDPPFQTLHDPDTGDLKAGMEPNLLINIPQPSVVTEVERFPMANPVKWADVYIYVYITWIDPDDNSFKSSQIEFAGGDPFSVEYTPDGFILTQYAGRIDFSAKAGVAYKVHGPIAQFVFAEDTKFEGGPDRLWSIPPNIDWASPQVTNFSVPLTFPVNFDDWVEGTGEGTLRDSVSSVPRTTYGNLTLVDWAFPTIETEVAVEEDATVQLTGGPYIASFRFSANYLRDEQQFLYYRQAFLDFTIGGGIVKATTVESVTIAAPLLGMRTEDIPVSGRFRTADGRVSMYTGYAFNEDGDYVFSVDISGDLPSSGDYVDIVEFAPSPDSELSVDGREGPVSEESVMISLPPGMFLKLKVDRDKEGLFGTQSIYRTAVYRAGSDTQGKYFEVTRNALGRVPYTETDDDNMVYYDSFLVDPIVEMPLTGNYPHATRDLALVGSRVHPAQFGVLFRDTTVYLSDPGRLWAYPLEYSMNFPQTVLAVEITGNSIIVFCEGNAQSAEGKIYEISGTRPGYLAMYELSAAHPLLNPTGLAKIGQRIFWPTYDGLATTSGNQVEILTERFFTRETWNEQNPDTMSAYTSESSVWLLTPGAANWRIDFGEMNNEPFTFLTTFTAFSGEEFVWQSKIFEFNQAVGWGYLRVWAEAYPVAVEVFTADGQQRGGMLVNSNDTIRFPRVRPERNWSVRIHGHHAVFAVILATSAAECELSL